MVFPPTPTSLKRKSPRLKKSEISEHNGPGGSKTGVETKKRTYASQKRARLASVSQNIDPYGDDSDPEELDLNEETSHLNSLSQTENVVPSRRDWEDETGYNIALEPTYLRSVKREHSHFTVPSDNSVYGYQNEDVLSDTILESSQNQKWLPISFARANMYDSENGIPLCRDLIEQNCQKLVKNKKPIDSNEFIQLASSLRSNPLFESLALGLAFMAEMHNKAMKSVKESKEAPSISMNDLILPKIGFNIARARTNENYVQLPSGRRFKMSSTLSSYSSSNYTSSNFTTHSKSIVRRALTKVAERDPFFPAYTSAETSNTYCPLGEQFFRSISAFLMNGFMQSPSDELETFTIRLCRDVLCSLLDRRRHLFHQEHPGTSCTELATDLKKILSGRGGRIPIMTMDFSDDHQSSSQTPSTSSTHQ